MGIVERRSTQSRYNRVRSFVRNSSLNKKIALLIGAFTLLSAPVLAVALTGNTASNTSTSTDAASSVPQPPVPTTHESADGTESTANEESSEDQANESSTSVTVNGQTVPVPQNGSHRETIVSNDGQTKVDVSIENHSTNSSSGGGDDSADTDTDEPIRSRSRSDIYTDIETEVDE